jgi:GT2 family glycosyltransferase
MNENGSGVVVDRTQSTEPTVAVIIPTRGTEAEVRGKNCVLAAHAIAQLVKHSTFQNFEIIVVVDDATPATALHDIETAAPGRVRIVPFNRPFNFAEKVNLGAAHTTADYLLLLNDDTEPSNPDLIQTMLSYFSDDTVGLVGPKLLYEDGSIQSAGHFFNPVPYDSYRGFPGNCAGAYNMLTVAREVSSVIAACALTPRHVFIEVGGLSTQFPSDYNDIDFALKIQLLGKRVLYTPYTDCFHFESKTREAKLNPAHVALLGERWRDQLENETYGHPALQKYQVAWKSNRPGQRSVDEAVGPTAPMASK